MLSPSTAAPSRRSTISHILPVRPVAAGAERYRARHDWQCLQVVIPTTQPGLYGVRFRCTQCVLERLVLCGSDGEIASVQTRIPGRSGWAALSYLRPSCPPSEQDQLWLERMAPHG